MKFIDEAKIEVHAGKGGDGAATFRREKYIRYGGPNGGGAWRGGFFPLPLLAIAGDFRGPERPCRLSYDARLSRTAFRAAACRRGSIVRSVADRRPQSTNLTPGLSVSVA